MKNLLTRFSSKSIPRHAAWVFQGNFSAESTAAQSTSESGKNALIDVESGFHICSSQIVPWSATCEFSSLEFLPVGRRVQVVLALFGGVCKFKKTVKYGIKFIKIKLCLKGKLTACNLFGQLLSHSNQTCDQRSGFWRCSGRDRA